ncbi:MAG TPA: tripartite tricarboxylate transporter TctB family protein [Syntrophorhabdaceae bacterium]|nr:tripartite tricarboxylate transporter TctB family protein [Syntrophorhabdaceae bacterium]
MGIIMTMSASRLGIGTPTEPGSGFLPLGTGILLAAVSLFGIRVDLNNFVKDKSVLFVVDSGKRILTIVISVFVYAFMLSRLGYLISAFLLMFVLFALAGKRKWVMAVLKSVVVTFITYLLFEKWLACRLPQGLLWF